MGTPTQDDHPTPESGKQDEAKPQAPAEPVSAPEGWPAEVLSRLTILDMSLQQLRMSIDILTGNLGSLSNSLMSAMASVNGVNTNLNYLTNMENMHATALSNLAASATGVQNLVSMVYADTQALRCFPQPFGLPPMPTFTAAPFPPPDAAAFTAAAMQRGETGNI